MWTEHQSIKERRAIFSWCHYCFWPSVKQLKIDLRCFMLWRSIHNLDVYLILSLQKPHKCIQFYRDGDMSQSGMELLLVETEQNFWPFLTGQPLPGPGSSCLHGPPSPPGQGLNPALISNAMSHPSESLTDGQERGGKQGERKTVAGYTRRPHSYCKFNQVFYMSNHSVWQFPFQH